MAKSGNKRGRPRKNPLMQKNESVVERGKKVERPKKVYDIDPNNNYRMDVSFNESDNKDQQSDYSDHNIHPHHESSPLGTIERNLKIADSRHTFSFDSMANFPKNNDNFSGSHMPFYPRKQSMTNPFDKFCGEVPANMDMLNDHARSRGVSSVLSPYHVVGTFPSIVSPSPIRGTPLGHITDFKSGTFQMRKMSTNQNLEDDTQNKLNDLISQQFKDFNPKYQRKDTEDIDFSGQDNTILNLLSKAGNVLTESKRNPFDIASGSILSPNYKPRSLSLNSNGWSLPPHSQLQKNSKSGWDLTKTGNNLGLLHKDSR